jgi:hypothetical protein
VRLSLPGLKGSSSRLTLALLLAACLGACSRSGAGDASASAEAGAPPSSVASPRTASCDRITSMSVCSEYSGAYLAQNEAVHSAGCVKLGGTFVAAECPNRAVLGSCTLSTGEVRKFYGSGGATYDLVTAEKECTGPYRGRWAALR